MAELEIVEIRQHYLFIPATSKLAVWEALAQVQDALDKADHLMDRYETVCLWYRRKMVVVEVFKSAPDSADIEDKAHDWTLKLRDCLRLHYREGEVMIHKPIIIEETNG